MDWSNWPALAKGLVPTVPPVVGDGDKLRSGFTNTLVIAGQALPPSMLAYGYLAANAGQKKTELRAAFRKTVQNLGIVWAVFGVLATMTITENSPQTMPRFCTVFRNAAEAPLPDRRWPRDSRTRASLTAAAPVRRSPGSA